MTSLAYRLCALAIGLAVTGGAAAADCIRTACSYDIKDGTYALKMPDQGSGPVPVVVILHGYGSNGLSMLRAAHVVGPMLSRGYAVIAPNGLRRGGAGPTRWNFQSEPGRGRDEAAFLKTVVADAASRHALDVSHVLLSGFSLGGSMTAYIACQHPEAFPAFAPVGGIFWRPLPTACQGPVKLFHTHGWADKTVPLEGRAVNSRATQGDVFQSFGILRRANACVQDPADQFSQTGAFLRRAWTKCAPGSALELALFPGGHKIPKGWADMVLTWSETQRSSEVQKD